MSVSQPLLWGILFYSALRGRLQNAWFPEQGRLSTSSPAVLANLVKGKSAGMSPTSTGWRWSLFRIHKAHKSWAAFPRWILIHKSSHVLAFCGNILFASLVRSKKQDFHWTLTVCSTWMWTKPTHCSVVFGNKPFSGTSCWRESFLSFLCNSQLPTSSDSGTICLWFRYT